MKSSCKLFVLLIISFCMASGTMAQDSNNLTESIDTADLSINHDDGWQLLNAYIRPTQTDSVRFELIIQHPNNVDWTLEQYFGKIKLPELAPAAEQSIIFKILENSYLLRIDTTGSCYLKFLNGGLPSADPVIIFLKVLYKL